MESRGPKDSKNVKTSQAYFFEGFISFFEDFSLTIYTYNTNDVTHSVLELIDLEHLVALSAEYGLRFIA